MPSIDLSSLPPGSLEMFHDDDNAGVGLTVSLPEGTFYRARGQWYPTPYDSTVFHGISLRYVHPDFVAFYDALQMMRLMPSVAQTTEFEIADSKPTSAPASPLHRPFGFAGPREAAVRGLLLGLALGDTVGSFAGRLPPSGPLPAGAATQLAIATTDALLRAEISRSDLVAKHPTDVAYRELARSYRAWAVRRGDVPEHHAGVTGWTRHIPELELRRGSSPTTVRAILQDAPVESHGYHSLLRALPIAAWNRPQEKLVRASVGFSHSAGVEPIAQLLVRLLRWSLFRSSLSEAATFTANSLGTRSKPVRHLEMVRSRAASTPCVPELLQTLAPSRSVASALSGGLYVAFSFPDADTIGEALEFASRAPSGNAVAAVTGAVLGAVHGVHALPVAEAQRLELGWVADAMARDLSAVGRVAAMEVLAEDSPAEAQRLRLAYPAIGDQ